MLLTPAAKFSIHRRYPRGGAGRSSGKSSFRRDWWRPLPGGQRRVGPRPRAAGGRPGGAGPGTSQLSLSRRGGSPPLDAHSGAASAPPQASPASARAGPATWGSPAGQLRAPRRLAALRGGRGELLRRLWEPFPRWAACEGMSADFPCLGSGGSGEGRRRRAEATVQGSAGEQQGGRCACP